MGDFCQPIEMPCPVVCPTFTASICASESDQICDMGVDMDGCWLGDYCQSNDVPCPDMTSYGTFDNICPTFTAAICDAETEQNCDMGMDMNGCWMGDYCMPEGEVCPPPPVTCPEMTASICDETSVNCDMGGDANGC